MKIVKLEAENVKRLKAVSITPDGNLIRINGNNGQGKTSVLDSIWYALGGKDAQPPEVIRRGEDQAYVGIDLGDIQILRRWTGGEKSTLEVRSSDGARYPSPQAMLDKLVGALSFDPMSFMRQEPKKQAATLRALVGLDFSKLDAQRATAFEKRTEVNAEGKALKARHDGIIVPPDALMDPVSVDDLVQQRADLGEVRNQNEVARRQAGVLKREALTAEAHRNAAAASVARAEDQWTRAAAALEEAKKEHERALTAHMEARAAAESADKSAAALVDPDLSVIIEKIRDATRVNDAVRLRKEKADLDKELSTKRLESAIYTDRIKAIDDEKASTLAAAKFPVDGLSFTDNGLTFGGLPLEQASAAEQLRVSLAMGIALNPKLKVLLIRDGSLLDENSLAMVAKMAADADAQVWLEMVGTGGVGILIEDGEVKS